MLLFLVISFAPFLVIAPLIGPVIDRAAGGRRTVIQLVAAARIVISLLMATAIDNLALFPLVFAALVLQKTYLVSKPALVPSVVRDERDLVEANSKLGLIAGLAGFVAIIPAAVMQLISNEGVATLIYAALLFGFALAARPVCRPTSSRPSPRDRPSGCSSSRRGCSSPRWRCCCCGRRSGSPSSYSPSGCAIRPRARPGSASPSRWRRLARCSAT